jgi:recombinational DNA repair protein RecR
VDAVNDACELRSCGVKFTHVHCRRCRKVTSTSPCALCEWRGDEPWSVPNFAAQSTAADVMFTETVRRLKAEGYEITGGGRDVSITVTRPPDEEEF